MLTFDRKKIEAAMDYYDKHRESGKFNGFGEPKEYWVRSTRKRANRIYPTKPIVGILLGVFEGPALSGGWRKPQGTVAALHNSGFIIVDEDDVPVKNLPGLLKQYSHLIRGAGRIRLCVVNYYIELAREEKKQTAQISVGRVARDMGLERSIRNICNALGGEPLQILANVPVPKRMGPKERNDTAFVYELTALPKAGLGKRPGAQKKSKLGPKHKGGFSGAFKDHDVWYVYTLVLRDKRKKALAVKVGYSSDPERRKAEHNRPIAQEVTGLRWHIGSGQPTKSEDTAREIEQEVLTCYEKHKLASNGEILSGVDPALVAAKIVANMQARFLE